MQFKDYMAEDEERASFCEGGCGRPYTGLCKPCLERVETIEAVDRVLAVTVGWGTPRCGSCNSELLPPELDYSLCTDCQVVYYDTMGELPPSKDVSNA